MFVVGIVYVTVGDDVGLGLGLALALALTLTLTLTLTVRVQTVGPQRLVEPMWLEPPRERCRVLPLSVDKVTAWVGGPQTCRGNRLCRHDE